MKPVVAVGMWAGAQPPSKGGGQPDTPTRLTGHSAGQETMAHLGRHPIRLQWASGHGASSVGRSAELGGAVLVPQPWVHKRFGISTTEHTSGLVVLAPQLGR